MGICRVHRLFYIQSVLVLSAVYSRDVSEMVVQKPLAFTKHSNILSDSFSQDKANLRNLETLSSQQLVAKSFEESSMRANFEAGGMHTILIGDVYTGMKAKAAMLTTLP